MNYLKTDKRRAPDDSIRSKHDHHNLGDAGCDWKDLVVSRIRMVPSINTPIISRGVQVQMKEKELAIVQSLVELPRERRLQEWSRQTGKSEPSLYRRLKELGPMDSPG